VCILENAFFVIPRSGIQELATVSLGNDAEILQSLDLTAGESIVGFKPGNLLQGIGDVGHAVRLQRSSPASQETVSERLPNVFVALNDFCGVLVRHEQVAVGEEHALLHEGTLLSDSVASPHGVGAGSDALDEDGVVG